VIACLATRYPKRLLGAIGLSTYLIGPDAEPRRSREPRPGLPGHGSRDPGAARRRAPRDVLRALGHAVSGTVPDAAFEISLEEIENVSAWLLIVCSATDRAVRHGSSRIVVKSDLRRIATRRSVPEWRNGRRAGFEAVPEREWVQVPFQFEAIVGSDRTLCRLRRQASAFAVERGRSS
jgi:hypothetical protein